MSEEKCGRVPAFVRIFKRRPLQDQDQRQQLEAGPHCLCLSLLGRRMADAADELLHICTDLAFAHSFAHDVRFLDLSAALQAAIDGVISAGIPRPNLAIRLGLGGADSFEVHRRGQRLQGGVPLRGHDLIHSWGN